MDGRSWPLEYPNIIYHFCSIAVFLKIIQNKKIWLTSLKHMNDGHENRYFLKLLKKYSEETNEENHTNFEKFACCFSGSPTDLAQWTRYADDGQGVAIGFKAQIIYDHLRKICKQRKESWFPNKLALTPVMYPENEEEERGLIKIFKENCDNKDLELLISNLARKIPDSDIKKLQTAKDSFARGEFIFGTVKHPCFKFEDEHRILLTASKKESPSAPYLYDTPQGKSEISSLCFRPHKGIVSPYFNLSYPEKAIASVHYIPTRCQMTKNDFEIFLTAHDLNAEIAAYDIPYRG